jgi:hypothetical protein
MKINNIKEETKMACGESYSEEQALRDAQERELNELVADTDWLKEIDPGEMRVRVGCAYASFTPETGRKVLDAMIAVCDQRIEELKQIVG